MLTTLRLFASNFEDPHLFADNIYGRFIAEFNKEYKLTDIKAAMELIP